MYNWGKSLGAGNEGVRFVIQLLQLHPDTAAVVDVQNDPAYQPRDIDILWERRRSDGSTTTVTVEVKWDRFATGNFAFETKSVVERNSAGCFLTSQADVWYYGFFNMKKLYILPLEQTRLWFSTHGQRYRRKVTSSSDKTGERWHTEFAVVPIADVVRAVPGVVTVDM